MTRERIEELRSACQRCKDKLGAPYPWIMRVDECLDEIERLQQEFESLKTEKQHLVNAAVKAIEDCRKRDLL